MLPSEVVVAGYNSNPAHQYSLQFASSGANTAVIVASASGMVNSASATVTPPLTIQWEKAWHGIVGGVGSVTVSVAAKSPTKIGRVDRVGSTSRLSPLIP
jgi:hypothetical protein